MARELWLGPILNSNRERLLARCRQMLAEGRGREFIYLAATRPMMDEITARLLSEGVAGTIDELNVFLLSGFSRRVVARARFSDTGEMLPYFAAIDLETRPVQRPLFSRIIAGLAATDQLHSFSALARTEGLVSSMVGLIAEIQRSGATATDFRQVVGRRRALDAESKPAPDPPPAERVEIASGDDEASTRSREAQRIASIDYDADTALVYEQYERILEANNLTDASRDYLRALAVLQGEFRGRPVRVPFVDESKLLIIDGFFDILPVHGELLNLLVRRFPETVVNLNFDQANPDAFSAFMDVIERFGERAGFAERVSADVLDVAPQLAALRRFLFNTHQEPVPHSADPAEEELPGVRGKVVLLEAPDRQREVRAVAKRIKQMILEEGYRPGEVAVVYRSRDRYERTIRDVFRDERVAISLGERRALTGLPSARAAMKILDAACSNRTRSGGQIRIARILAILKSDYFTLGRDRAPGPTQEILPFDLTGIEEAAPAITPDQLENAVAFVGAELNLSDWLARAKRVAGRLSTDDRMRALFDLDAPGSDDGESPAELNEVRSPRAKPDFPLDTLRKAIGVVEAVGGIVLSIPFEAPVETMAAAFRQALDLLSFRALLVDRARRAVNDEEALRRAALDLRGLEGLNRAMDAVAEASRLASGTAGTEASVLLITRNEFRSDLHRAMDAHELAIAPERTGVVRVLGATDLRGMRFSTIFVLGLVEGEFPERSRGDWIYPQHERDNLKEAGLALEDISPEESLRAEEHYFYQVACRATQTLYLCRPLLGDEDAESIPSYFLTEVRRVLPAQAIVTSIFPSGFDGETVLDSSTPRELALGISRARAREQNPTWPDVLSTSMLDALEGLATEEPPGGRPVIPASVLRRIDVERRRETGPFDEFDGRIGNSHLRGILNEVFSVHTFSASEFNEFGNCAYRFFLKRVLALVPRVEAALDLQAIDEGILLHNTLRRFFEQFRNENLAEQDKAYVVERLRASADEVFQSFERGMPPLNPKLWRIERHTLELLLDRFVDDERELQGQLAAVGMRPRYFELAFGMPRMDSDPASSAAALVLTRDGTGSEGASIAIRGQIDRVDRSKSGVLVAYDYKKKAGPRVRDMLDGRDVQLGIYLEAIDRLFLREGEIVAGGGYYAIQATPRRNNGLYNKDYTDHTALGRPDSNMSEQAWLTLRERIVEHIWSAFDRIRRGDFRLAPSENDATCSVCDYTKVCRFDRHRIRIKKRMDANRPFPDDIQVR